MTTVVLLTLAAALVYLGVIAAALIAGALRAGGRLEEHLDDDDAVSVSRFTIPVSVIIPADRLDAALLTTVRAALGLTYPEFEVIVVTSDGDANAIASLDAPFRLEAREFFYRRALETAAVRRIYRSGTEARLTIIDTPRGTLADALNSGVNLARYRYVVTIPSGIRFDGDALLRIMSPAFRDPSTIVAVSNHVELGSTADQAYSAPMTFLGRLQRLSSLRALMESRLVWSALRRGLGPEESIVVWRRDAVLNAGGFAPSAADPNLDLMYRVQTLPADRSERVIRRTDVFGRRDPESLGAMLARTSRRQRAALQLLRALLRPTLRTIGPRASLAVLATEILTPFAEFWVIVACLIAVMAGALPWYAIVLAVLALGLGNAAVTSAGLLLRGSTPSTPEERELRQLMVAGALELVLVGPLRVAGRLSGVGAYFLRA